MIKLQMWRLIIKLISFSIDRFKTSEDQQPQRTIELHRDDYKAFKKTNIISAIIFHFIGIIYTGLWSIIADRNIALNIIDKANSSLSNPLSLVGLLGFIISINSTFQKTLERTGNIIERPDGGFDDKSQILIFEYIQIKGLMTLFNLVVCFSLTLIGALPFAAFVVNNRTSESDIHFTTIPTISSLLLLIYAMIVAQMFIGHSWIEGVRNHSELSNAYRLLSKKIPTSWDPQDSDPTVLTKQKFLDPLKSKKYALGSFAIVAILLTVSFCGLETLSLWFLNKQNYNSYSIFQDANPYIVAFLTISLFSIVMFGSQTYISFKIGKDSFGPLLLLMIFSFCGIITATILHLSLLSLNQIATEDLSWALFAITLLLVIFSVIRFCHISYIQLITDFMECYSAFQNGRDPKHARRSRKYTKLSATVLADFLAEYGRPITFSITK